MIGGEPLRKAQPRALLVGLAVVLAILVLPPAASAKEIFDIEHPGIAATMVLRGSHGYQIKIEGVPGGRVRLKASKNGAFAEYEVAGRVTRHGLHANFGQLGRISVRFRRVGKPREGGPPLDIVKCKGRDPIREEGRFVGTIRFRGEQGFTGVAAHRTLGSVTHRFKRRCQLPRRQHGLPAATASLEDDASLLTTALIAGTRSDGRTSVFTVIAAEAETPKGKRVPLLSLAAAATSERHGRVSIRRAALIDGDPGNVLASPLGEEPVTATVSLPRPFAGTASFVEEPPSPPSWTGSLHVRLPGAENVPLAGPDFTTALCRGKNQKKFKSCVDRATKTIPQLPGV